jgi:hypothetical protein
MTKTMTMMTNLACVLLVAGSVAACSPYSPDLGVAPFLCGDTDPMCPEGYECMPNGSGASVCVQPNGMIPDGGTGVCADDSALEPNDTIQTAFQTPVADTKPSLTFAGLAICPMGDKDTYSIHIPTENMNLEVIVEYDPNGAVLNASILNAGGVPIASASPVMEGQIRAYTANLPSGTYYAQVTGPTSGTLLTNNYKLTINTTGP